MNLSKGKNKEMLYQLLNKLDLSEGKDVNF